MNRDKAISENRLRRVKKTCYFCKKYDLFNMQCEQNKPTMEMDIIQDACDLFVPTDAWQWVKEAERFINKVIDQMDLMEEKLG